ncbi:metallopeptidase [Rhodococcus sp. RS1C4]|uniref:neutral zinc metallopeptidase n=1 Tax=Nocardiaceae TaxID=85025 RepID=UPI00037C512F|nr:MULTISPECIES: neutral zinc metallopeptidase [Rhodococcus]OZC48432.1 metallopeptidase [Rhodococcus sp. RS1C4]OZC79210.1 metallopeptidase [Rhodococcus sp. 06-418-1B]OZD12619.1 metallopeptidase [Rhodococcus sp. 06-156-4C]OZD24240.1 metallopeptidase [Rhodococcus sp. 06-156-3C]OZD27350.1 metallopeptidase [Rhodococcus sp. 06-156-4a]
MSRGRTRRTLWMTALIAASALLASCAQSVDGRAVSIYDNPFTVAGLPVTDGPSGPRPGMTNSTLQVTGSEGTDSDVIATNAIEDIQRYWTQTYPDLFKTQFTPVSELISWDASEEEGQGARFCGFRTGGIPNAAYCMKDDTIGWDRTILLPALIDAFGPMAVVMVIAHEYGHSIQHQSGLVGEDTPTIVAEQQADCFAGAFIRHVAEDESPHFTINTSDGLNGVLAATVAVRDVDPNDPDSVHGSAFERVTAVQLGFTDGASACVAIDEAEIDSRRADLPQKFSDADDDGELPVTEETLQAFVRSFESLLALPNPPTVSYDGTDTGCPEGTSTEPVSYCASSNTIGVDVPALAELGTAERPRRGDVIPLNVSGDYSAYVLFASRYTLAVQNAAGQPLDNPQTALRSACLSGVITAGLSSENPEATDLEVWLSPGDLDEAVSGLLSDGLTASDINGVTLPSGFSRVDAFRSGVLGGQDTCNARYR